MIARSQAEVDYQRQYALKRELEYEEMTRDMRMEKVRSANNVSPPRDYAVRRTAWEPND